MVSYLQKISVVEMLIASLGRPAKSVGGHVKHPATPARAEPGRRMTSKPNTAIAIVSLLRSAISSSHFPRPARVAADRNQYGGVRRIFRSTRSSALEMVVVHC